MAFRLSRDLQLPPRLQVAFADYSPTLVDYDEAKEILYCHQHRTASLWPSNSHHVRLSQESHLYLTASKFTATTPLCADDPAMMLQLLRQSSAFSGTVPVIDHVSYAIYGEERPVCGQCDMTHVELHPPFVERYAADTPDSGWPAPDETADSLCQITLAHRNLQSSYFRGWGGAIYRGGHPAWGRCEIIHMEPNPSFAERCAAATQDNGWLASDEALWFLRLLKDWRSDIAIGPIIQWSPSRDLQHLMAAEDQLQCNNGQLNILLFLVEAHWCAVEIDRRTEPVHVILIQWPQEHHTMVTLEVSRILQIPSHRMLVTLGDSNEVITMCGWTILFRWYTNFAMQTCLQPLVHANEQDQIRIDSVIHRAQRQWDRTNASNRLRRFAVECRRAFMSAYARDQPDTRLPDTVSTVMFVGPQEDYIQEVIAKCHDRPRIEKGRSTGYVICLPNQHG